MGVTPTRWPREPGWPRWLGWLGAPVTLRRLALASVIANVLIVVGGGTVRLTASGLGCPTWPSCTDGSLTPTREFAAHGIIEFTNRQLTFVLGIVAALTLVAAIVQRRERTLAGWALGIIPIQAVVGGISVKTDLNPWVVSLHFLVSIGIIAVTVVLYRRLQPDPVPAPATNSPALAWLGRAAVLVTAAVLVAGTIVTGAGPHAGDKNASGKVHRNGLDVSSMSQLHADLVMVLIGLTLGLLALVYVIEVPARTRRAVWVLVAVELGQAVIGFVQYFTGVPALLVGLHMFGACILWIAVLGVLLRVQGRPAAPGQTRSGTLNRPKPPADSRRKIESR
jgi:cytochrome c oxidase assembly protein subunit 15